MSTTNTHAPMATPPVPTGWYNPTDCDLDEFRRVVEQTTEIDDYPHADEVFEKVLVYGERLRAAIPDTASRHEVQAELARALLSGPGIVVFRGAVEVDVVDRATEALLRSDRGAGNSRRELPATTSASPEPTTASGARWTSSRAPTPRCSRRTTPPMCSRWSARPGSGLATRSRHS